MTGEFVGEVSKEAGPVACTSPLGMLCAPYEPDLEANLQEKE